jgi:CheY-like chemotaxis protein
MAEMTGEQLAVRIKELNPKTPVILLTGYTGDSTVGKPYSKAIDLVLEKPLSRAALRHAFAKVVVVN